MVNFKLLFLAFFLQFFVLNTAHSQNRNGFIKKCLWLREIDTFNLDSLQKKEVSINFNRCLDFSNKSLLKEYKKLIGKKASIFTVLKSIDNKEIFMFSLQNEKSFTSFTNKKVVIDDKTTKYKGNIKNGVIVSLTFQKNSISNKKGSLVFEESLLNDAEGHNQIAELICIPYSVSYDNRLIIETYLSIKYGISLHGESSYVNSKGEIIWDFEQNRGYNNQITGVGKDTLTGLFQKQSKNVEEEGMILGLGKVFSTNSKNTSKLDHNDFILWGNTGESLEFKEFGNSKFLKTERTWKLKTISSTSKIFSIQILIDKNKLFKKSNELDNLSKEYWLAIDSTNSSNFIDKDTKLIRGVLNDKNEIVFDDIKLSSNSSYFFKLVKLNNKVNSPLKPDYTDLHINTENFSDDQVLIYPNPIKINEYINIDFKLNEESKINIEILDVGGRVLRARQLGVAKSLFVKEIFQIAGTYIIKVTINDVVKSYKIVVN